MTSSYRVVVIDDEPPARAGIGELLARDPEIATIVECAGGREGIDAIRDSKPDFVILDITMPEVDGFDVIREIGPERMPPVIFTTAFDQFAVQAFEVHALDYLLKPFADHRFADALARAKSAARRPRPTDLEQRLAALLSEHTRAPDESQTTWLSRIVVKKPGSSILVPVEDIDWIESADYCVRIHARQKIHVVRETMQNLESRLDPRRFFRVHRSGIVNLDRIREIQPAFHGDLLLILTDGSQVKLSRSRRSALEERLGQAL